MRVDALQHDRYRTVGIHRKSRMPSPAAIRRKDPIRNRAALIEAATAVIVEQGLAKLTVDAVAKAAGVTKGGLFHHFASKDDLIQGVLSEMLESGERQIEAAMAADPEPHGRFTRAYLNGVCGEREMAENATSRALCVAMLGDPTLSDSWCNGVAEKVKLHADTDDNTRCAVVRLAADGIWLNSLARPNDPVPVCDDVKSSLMALTYPTS